MKKEEKLKLLNELEEDLLRVRTKEDVKSFYTQARIILEKLCGEESTEVKLLKETYENYNLSEIPVVMSSTSFFNENYKETENQKNIDIEEFKRGVQNIISAIKRLISL